MRRTILFLTLVGALMLACSGVVLAQSTTPSDKTTGGPPSPLPGNAERVCAKPTQPEKAACHAVRRTDIGGGAHPKATTSYSKGYGPSELQSAYNIPTSGGSGKTIAIVDAYDNPNAQSDLAAYRAQFNLPPLNSSGGPTFKKVDQRGGTNYPSGDTGWGQEIALDLDMASAICPDCNILLVEADSNSYVNLGTAVNKAAELGANSISNSYGGNEFSSETSYESPYQHPGIAVTVSSGDSGYGVEFPASSRYVTAVGGTSLSKASNTRGWSESVWSGAGSGCSAYIPKPSWQTDTGCSKRTVADVSAVADPNTGVAVYDSYGSTGGANWYVFGGTSVASPIIASVYALAGNAAIVTKPDSTGAGGYGSYPYSHTSSSSLNDVTSGSNGKCTTRRSTSKAYLCTGGSGYDGPSGLGTPSGTGAF